ncbi:uncharacterized protein LOC135959765 [Calliphora vicina]|uniref:uncharacterized protein LOC135959765 n=1 Tax=Calliphora vicina TaxID=7373 RepID=UPI00325AA086
MPATRNIKCGKCSDGLSKTQGAIQCTSCKLWLHLKCADVAEKHLSLLKDKPASFFFKCAACSNADVDDNSFRHEMLSMKNSFECFVVKSQSDHNAFKDSIAQILSDFKNEVSTVVKEIKSDIMDCRKLINHVDSSTNMKISALETENNILHRRLNRGDFVISGLPSGLNDLDSAVISLGAFYNVTLSNSDINHVCYMHSRRLILVKLNNVGIRDKIMKEYFKQRSLTVKNIIGGEIESRVYINDHYSPAASNLNALCRKMFHQKIILKYRIVNADHLKAKLTLSDGKDVEYSMAECAELFNVNSNS